MFTEIYGDDEFERFKRDLAVYVLLALANGKKVSASWYDDVGLNTDNPRCCPAGCHPNATSSAPPRQKVARLFNITERNAGYFTTAFGEEKVIPEECFGKLGKQYREMFP